VNEQVRRPIVASELQRIGTILNPVYGLRLSFERAQLFAMRAVADDQKAEFARPPLRQDPERFEERARVFLRRQTADVEQGLLAWRDPKCFPRLDSIVWFRRKVSGSPGSAQKWREMLRLRSA